MTRLDRAKADLVEMAPAFAKKVAPIYALLDWKWTGFGVPDESAILASLLHLIDSLDESMGSIRTGGLSAWYEPDGNECGIEFHFYEMADTFDEIGDDAPSVKAREVTP